MTADLDIAKWDVAVPRLRQALGQVRVRMGGLRPENAARYGADRCVDRTLRKLEAKGTQAGRPNERLEIHKCKITVADRAARAKK